MRQAAGGVASSRTANFFVFLTVDTRTHALGNAELERSYVDLDNRRGRLMIKRALTIIFLSLSMAVPSEAAEQVRIAYNNLLPPFAEAKDGKEGGPRGRDRARRRRACRLQRGVSACPARAD